PRSTLFPYTTLFRSVFVDRLLEFREFVSERRAAGSAECFYGNGNQFSGAAGLVAGVLGESSGGDPVCGGVAVLSSDLLYFPSGGVLFPAARSLHSGAGDVCCCRICEAPRSSAWMIRGDTARC